MGEHFDTIVIGAGLSGIAAGYRLQYDLKGKSYAILEGRDSIGGTWDLFRYPGIRSDSDMYTMGYSFAPWLDRKMLADGETILNYIKKTADEFDIRKNIRTQHWVQSVSWSDETNVWTLAVQRPSDSGPSGLPVVIQMTAQFIFMCTGYYDYDSGYAPVFPGADRFSGKIIHPQHWPKDLDYKNKQVVVIGSGATAVTLVPAMAPDVKHITMLQRSPTYIASLPAEDPIALLLLAVLPTKFAHFLNRWKNIVFGTFWFWFCKTFPRFTKRLIIKGVTSYLGSNQESNFTPKYNPWDQRFCVIPDGDLFKAIKHGKASVVTGEIETFTETGIIVKGKEDELKADIIVSATGLNIKLAGGVQFVVNGVVHKDMSKMFMYKGIMLSGVPNLIFSIGYTNATFTLKVDLVGIYLCRLMKYMDAHGYKRCCPVYGSLPGENINDQGEPLLNLSSGYLQRADNLFPKQGKQSPWRYYQNYFYDLFYFRVGSINDGSLKFW